MFVPVYSRVLFWMIGLAEFWTSMPLTVPEALTFWMVMLSELLTSMPVCG